MAATRTFLSQEPVQQVPQVTSHLVSGDLPVEDPYAVAWLRIGEQRLAMQVQNVVVPFKTGAALPTVSVRSLHNGREIAFRLEWEDPHLDDLTVRTDQFRDACGVLLGSPTAVWTMGSPDDPVTILHWKADWQRDLEQGYQDLEAAFPNAAFDFYPPLVGVARPSPEDYPPEARHRLPGLAVGNPLSQPRRPSAVEKLQAMGPGTILTLPTQDARGRGVWRDGRWAVVLTKRLEPSDQGELRLEPGGSYAVAFAVWLGSAGDRGARKSISQLGTLWLEASR
ncbi:MAG TPA: ethylbenzene dehydrogenase-related protein [Dehalococcoidia bacterium]|nr:ethylbenzene dehydrogenase-related protein [Dehalococcoidia bacterium]